MAPPSSAWGVTLGKPFLPTGGFLGPLLWGSGILHPQKVHLVGDGPPHKSTASQRPLPQSQPWTGCSSHSPSFPGRGTGLGKTAPWCPVPQVLGLELSGFGPPTPGFLPSGLPSASLPFSLEFPPLGGPAGVNGPDPSWDVNGPAPSWGANGQ